MNISREEYLWQLSQQLYHIPAEEREAALEYYRNYFEEAGAENEEHVMAELGSPEELARSIIADVMDDAGHDTVREPLVKKSEAGRDGSSEPGWEKYRRQMEREEREAFGQDGAAARGNENRGSHRSARPRRKVNIWMILFLAVTFPVWGGIVLSIIGVVIGLICGAVGLVIGLVGAGAGLVIALIVGALIGIIKSVLNLITAPFAAGFAICLSLVMLAAGVLLARLFGAIVKRLFPSVAKLFGKLVNGIVRGVGGICRSIFGRS